MKTKQVRAKRKDQIKIILCFKDGREIPGEDFDEERDLTDKQREFIVSAFTKVFSRPT